MEQHKVRIMLLATFAAMGCGMMAGILFAFSNFVMTALSRQPPASAIRTMQAINIYILNPLFFALFLGTAVASLVLAAWASVRLPSRGAFLLLAGSNLYLVGTVGVTLIFNVPLNNKLAELNPESTDAATYWLTYLHDWMRWNHVRTVAATIAAALLMWAIQKLQFAAE